MLMDIQIWLIEIAKSLGKLFLNPMLYWGIMLVLLAGSKRIRRERKQFGFKVFPMFSELKGTWLSAILIGLLLSILFVGIGIVFPYSSILLLSVIVVLLSLHMKFTLLSASYTIGLTYFIILLSPLLLQYQSYIDPNIFAHTPLTGLAILLGLLLIVEAFFLKKIDRNDTFPELVKSERGRWVGQHRLKKLMIIPFFVLIPSGLITSYIPFWPYFSIGEETYSLLLVPFLLGFDITVRRQLSGYVASRLGHLITLLGFIVLFVALGSIYIPLLSFIAVIVALIGREYILYQHKVLEEHKKGYFTQVNEGLKVLSIMPHTPGANLGILVGETITKVNGIPVHTVGEFYESLQASGAYFKLDVIDDAGEVRFVQSAFYAGDHHKLGLIFTEEPYYEKRIG